MKKLLVVFSLLAFVTLALVGCNKPTPEPDPVPDEFDYAAAVTTLSQKVAEINNLLDGAVVGEKKGNYPQSAVDALQSALTTLEASVANFQAKKGDQKALDAAVKAATDAISAFKDAQLKEDVPFQSKAGYVWVDNSTSESSYIDFGNNPEFINFGQPNAQTDHTFTFTVDLEVYLPAWPDACWQSVLFASTEGGVDNGGGWGTNEYDNGKYRWVIIDEKTDGGRNWCEEEYRFGDDRDMRNDFAGGWHHICMTYRDKGVPGKGDHMNMFFDGTRNCGKNRNDSNIAGYSASNAGITHMFAFARTPNDLTPEGAATPKGGWCNPGGSIRNLHLWSRILTNDEIADLAAGVMEVTAESEGLVAGWTFTETVENDQDIKDITGKFSAKLCGPNAKIIEGKLQ
jgi:hypothetical protein